MSRLYLILALLYLGLGVGSSLLLYRRVFSPVGAFGSVFGLVFLLLVLPVVRYTPLDLKATLAFIAVLIATLLGTGISAFASRLHHRHHDGNKETIASITRLRRFLFVTNVVATVGVLLRVILVLRFFGGVSGLVQRITYLYVARVAGEIPIPPWAGYLSAVSYSASYLAGCYLALKGRYKLLVYWSFFNIVTLSFALMGRATIIEGALLFYNGYALTRSILNRSQRLNWKRVKQLIGLVVIGFALLALMIMVRQVRGGGDNFRGTASRLRDYSNLAYADESSLFWNSLLSNYVYVTGGVPAFGYKAARSSGLPLTWGGNTLGSLAGLVGFSGARYLDASPIPFRFNIYTAVWDWMSDFGWLGVVIVPFLASLLAGSLFEKAISGTIRESQKGTLALMMFWLEYSVFKSISVQGFFWITLAWLVFGGYWLEHSRQVNRRNS